MKDGQEFFFDEDDFREFLGEGIASKVRDSLTREMALTEFLRIRSTQVTVQERIGDTLELRPEDIPTDY